LVKSLINLTDYEDMVVNIVKAKHGFRNKNEAIRYIIKQFESEFLEPELRPEFVDRMKERENEPVVKIKDIKKHFGLDDDV
jgi:mannitol/fructose-specific phosphotransferase system IIA component